VLYQLSYVGAGRRVAEGRDYIGGVLRRVAKFAVAVTVAAPGFSKAIDDGDVARWAKAGGVGYLIGAAWTEGEARDRGVTVSDDDARDAIAPPHDRLTQVDRLYEARIELLDARIKQPISQAAAESVTQRQIDEYVTAHPKTLPERRRVRTIDASTQKRARQIEAAIKRGETWKAAAKRHDADVSTITAEPGVVAKPLKAAIDNAREHQVTRFRRTVFEVIAIRPARPMPIDQQKAQAWELLASQAQAQAIAAYEHELQAKWRPATTCAPAVAAPDFCSNSPTGQ
jgi:hypothetical protein